MFKYAPLQGSTADEFRAQGHPIPSDLSQVALYKGGTVYLGANGIIESFEMLGGRYKNLSVILKIVPAFIRAWAYRLTAKTRFRIFGQTEELCPLVPPEKHYLFLP